MKKAVLYARVSSDLQQKERSIESQIAELKKQIDKAGDKLVKEYVDDGYSGALLDRPAMNELRSDLKADKFETIYILNADRIARDVTYQNIIVGEMLRYKKQIIINGKDYIHNPENKFTLTVLGAVSELERAKLIERVVRGRQHRLAQGILLGNGHHLYGYTYHPKTATSWPSYTVNKAEAKVVRYAFATYAKGNIGIQAVSQQIKSMGVPMIKGRNCLNQSSLQHILANRTYLGVRYFNTMKESRVSSDPLSGTKRSRREYTDPSEWVGVKIPAIISKDLYDKVQVRLEYNRTCWRNSKRVQLLSNLVWCDKCGSRCFACRRAFQYRDRKHGKTYKRVVYKCGSKAAGIHNPEINSQVLESCVWDMVKETLAEPEKLYSCISFLKRKKRANHIKTERQLKELGEKIHTFAAQKKRIVDIYASGDLEREDYLKRTSGYDRDIENLKASRQGLLRYIPLFQEPALIQATAANYSKELQGQFDICDDFDSKRKFLLDHITKVSYYRKSKAHMKVSVHGAMPIKVGGQEGIIIPAEFKIEKVMDWHEIQARIPKSSPEDEIECRPPVFTWRGRPIKV